MVLPPSHRIPRVPWYSGFRPSQFHFAYGIFTLFDAGFPTGLRLASLKISPLLTPRTLSGTRFGLFRVRSPLLTESLFVFSSWGYLDVSVPPVSLRLFRYDAYASVVCGFPHSDIRASSVICTYTRLFAACHVLLRLPVPGHPPCALSSLTFVLVSKLFRLLSEIFSVKDIEFHKNPKSQNTSFDVLPLFLSLSSHLFVMCYSVFKVRLSGYFLSFSGAGGDSEIRTRDPLLARQVLSQLSYTPGAVYPLRSLKRFPSAPPPKGGTRARALTGKES